jgi:hypothetical protein
VASFMMLLTTDIFYFCFFTCNLFKTLLSSVYHFEVFVGRLVFNVIVLLIYLPLLDTRQLRTLYFPQKKIRICWKKSELQRNFKYLLLIKGTSAGLTILL